MTAHSSSDVCLVGGGPAGLAAALALSDAGFCVTVLDCAVPPIDKACGEGLLPDSLAALSDLGIVIPPEVGFPFLGVRFSDGRCSALAEFPAGPGLGIRRTVLHSLLARRAGQLGVTLRWGVKNVQLAPDGVSCSGHAVRSKFVIAADGQNSALRRQAGLDRALHEQRRYGFRRHYRVKPWSAYMELHWGRTSQIYVTPISAEEVGIALISRDPTLRLDRALDEFPEVQGRLKGASHASAERGALSVSRTLQRVATGRFALIGDASGSVDALTGEGMGLSFRQALALAEALKSANLDGYSAQHRKLSRRPRTMASLLLMLERHSNLRTRTLAALASNPLAFETLLAVHVGHSSAFNLFSWRTVRFLARLSVTGGLRRLQ